MSKFSTFLIGLVLGAVLIFVSLKYHVVRASDGYHWVPKSSAKLGWFYADVREFTVDDWRKHQELVLDITKSDDSALQELAAKSALGNTLDSAWDNWTSGSP